MGINQKNLSSRNSEYTLTYSDIQGVDLSPGGSKKSRSRFSYLENMYKDYYGGGDGVIESIPGFRKLVSLGGHIQSIFSHKGDDGREYLVVHSGTNIYRFAIEDRDSISSPTPICTVKNTKTHAFVSGNDLFILDGENITRVKGDGTARVVDYGPSSAYIPTTYINGKEYEQRNLLSNRFSERFTITSVDDFLYGTRGLTYRILSPNEKTCIVTGIDDDVTESIHIPSYAEIDGEKYAVCEIADVAFQNLNYLEEVYISAKTVTIGKNAFYGCSALTKAVVRNGTERIECDAFNNCTSLTELYLGAGVSYIGSNAFASCTSLTTVYYALSNDSLENIEGRSELGSRAVITNVSTNYAKIALPIFSPAVSLVSLTVGGESMGFEARAEGGIMRSLVIETENKDLFSGKEAVIVGIMDPVKVTKNSVGNDFITLEGEYITGPEAIKGCRVCECFDGRVFLSGNERLPNTVFYSSRNITGRNDATYFGVLNYFNDGTGSFAVKSLLTAGDSLAVFKEGDDGGGSIYYHTPKETGIDILPKIYPVTYIHSGISALGESISFFDDPVFISALGLSALEKKNINLEKSVVTRSHNVNTKLLSEDLKKISLTKWCGYLVVCAGEHIYLADSRAVFTHTTGNTEYEWYFLSGIGTYVRSYRVYRYASVAKGALKVYSKPNERIKDDTVFSYTNQDGSKTYYVLINNVRYQAEPSEELYNGIFSPASCVYGCTDENLLFFGTESGDLCIFNNDKRGVAPPYISEKSDFDQDEYKRSFGHRIHPYYYSFTNYAPRYALTTPKDDCSIPHLTKSTVKNSLTVKVKNFGSGKFICESGTEKSGYKELAYLPGAGLNFEETDFSGFSFSNSEYTTLPLKEREKGWVEKELNFYTDEFRSPFGISNIAYRFTVKGKIKKG